MKALLNAQEQLSLARTEKLLLEEKTKQFDDLKSEHKTVCDELAITKEEPEKERSKKWYQKFFSK